MRPPGRDRKPRAAARGRLLLVVALLALAVPRPLPAGKASPAGDPFADANARWRGATCRLRLPIEIKKNRDRDGWSGSGTLLYQERGEKPFGLRFKVSDREALERLTGARMVVPGTLFVAQGWRLDDPPRGGPVVLDLRFAEAPIEARIEFVVRGNPLKRIEQLERYARIDAFRLAAADEQLVEPVVEAKPSGTSRPAEASPDAVTAAFDPRLEVLAVAVDPPETTPGGTVELVMTYSLAGVPPGAAFQVTEVREVWRDGDLLKRFEQRLERVADQYVSAQQVRLPSRLEPGVYTLKATVSLAGLQEVGRALFLVKLGTGTVKRRPGT